MKTLKALFLILLALALVLGTCACNTAGTPGKDGKDGKDGTSLQYDLQYDPATHVLCLLCNGEVVRSFDLTQELDELLGILDTEGANLLDCEGAVILPL